VPISDAREEVDAYFGHPARDFAKTDEALRIRRIGPDAWITYKGPKIDSTTKTRCEIELPLMTDDSTSERWADLLIALGFQPVAEVRKHRRKAIVHWQGRRVEISLDEVHGVGDYVELELIADEDDLEPARACIQSLAQELDLSGSERRSYLELLLERRGRAGS
jgi:adenylate cyclase class 2